MTTPNNKIDFAIITAMQKELDAVLSKLDTKAVAEKPLIFHLGHLGNAKVVVTCSGERNINAAAAAATVLERYHPTYLLMVGIAAGFESAGVNLGDVVIAKACYYDGPGKETPVGKELEPDQIPTSQALCAFSQNYQKLDWKANIRVPSPANSFQPSVHYGRIVSSETVIANKEIMASLLAKHRKLRALAQEGYGVAKVAQGRNVDFLEIRGICDFGTEEKNDKWHDYAADVAAAYAVGLLRYIEVTYIFPKPDTSPVSTKPPESLDLSRLPRPAMPLIGRQPELQQVQQAFLNPKTYLTILVAAGGIGKSALSDAWLKQIQPHYHGVQRVFAWSFYSQGSHNTQTSSVPFFQVALPFFGWTGEIPKDDVAKGRELAKCLQSQSFILILDGLEPLQQPTHILEGELKDTALQAFLEEVRLYGLAASPSLILISSRQPLKELQEWETERYVTIDLQTLPVSDGAQVLAALGVQGGETELMQTSEEMGGHALALVLLGKLLKEKFAGRIERRDQLPKLWEVKKLGEHALRVLQCYEKFWQRSAWQRWWHGGETPERAFLYLLGLFDRPMTLPEKEVLVTQAKCAEPLRALDDVGWELLEGHLEAAGLLNHPQPLLGKEGSDHPRPLLDKEGSDHPRPLLDKEGSDHPRPLLDKEGSDHLSKEGGRLAPLLTKEGPGVVARYHWDCHPLIRDYFGQRFQDTQPDLFRQAQRVLFDYYQSVPTKTQPDTIADLEPLYRAVVHGCLAGEYQKALYKVYVERILRSEYYSLQKLGAYSQDLTALVAFFPHGWSHPLQYGLAEAAQAWLLASASFCLMSLGRLGEALEPREAGLKLRVKLQDWEGASVSAQNLIDLYLPLGQLAKATTVARQSLQNAKQSGVLFEQMASHAYLATTLHRQGQLGLAQQSFQRAEQLQQENAPAHPQLYSLPGFWYGALLLDQAQSVAEYETVLGRAKTSLKWYAEAGKQLLLDISLDHLTLARILTQLQRDDEAATYFDQAVAGIRKAGMIHRTPPFLIDRANFHLRQSRLNLEAAAHDLQEADSLIRRCGMKLYAVDCQLAWCRYYLARGEKETARQCWGRAKMGMEVTGYGLREREVEDLNRRLH